MSNTSSQNSFHSFTLESSLGFESPPPPPSTSGEPSGLSIVTSQGNRIIFHPGNTDVIQKFLDWWHDTPFAKKSRDDDVNFRWMPSSRKSFVWDHFNDVAEYPNGTPKVQCTHCKQLFSHPANRNLGTHALASHLRGRKCSSPMSTISPSSGNIMTMMSNAVSACFTYLLLPILISIIDKA